MKYIISFAIGYILGCINPAYICGKIKGIDIRDYGSHNAGASNAKIVLGWPYFFIVLIYDFAKSVIAILLARYLFNNDMTLGVVAGCAAVVGHNYPFYMNFKGGKGFASYIGLSFLINWKVFLIVAAVGVIISLLSNWIVAATISFTIGVPCAQLFLHDCGVLAVVLLFITSAIILSKHIENFKRLPKKKEIGINGCYVGTKIKADIKQ